MRNVGPQINLNDFYASDLLMEKNMENPTSMKPQGRGAERISHRMKSLLIPHYKCGCLATTCR
ncbi:MAG: hypothetical protein OEY49_03095 [Candidatus Heimdallarchaeota archaeon]|nr:hypothetical protein [Candidatus Heimdallarchaeota archaeon]